MPLNDHIYENFARIYDGEMSAFRFHDRWRTLFDSLALPPGRALDLACGTGTVALEMAKRGWRVKGVDASEAMLAVARRREGGGGVEWHLGDMRNFEVKGEVDLVTCAFDSVNYLLEERDVKECFHAVSGQLAAGGKFLFDVLTPWGMKSLWRKGAHVKSGPGYFRVWEAGWEAPFSHLTVTCFERRGDVWERWQERHTERAFGTDRIRGWLKGAGLAVKGEWDETGTAGKKWNSNRVFLLADKSH